MLLRIRLLPPPLLDPLENFFADFVGDPEIFELMILVKIEILDIQKNFKSKQNYNNNDNKFKLKEFESEIEKQLVSEIIDEILIYLTLFK